MAIDYKVTDTRGNEHVVQNVSDMDFCSGYWVLYDNDKLVLAVFQHPFTIIATPSETA